MSENIVIEDINNICLVPPQGWFCTRARGHYGPCAAHPEVLTKKITKKFAKLFEVAGYGQVLAKIDRSDVGNPEFSWYAWPPEYGICALSTSFDDTEEGWNSVEAAFNDANQNSAENAASILWSMTGSTKQ